MRGEKRRYHNWVQNVIVWRVILLLILAQCLYRRGRQITKEDFNNQSSKSKLVSSVLDE
jgi:hypothetical protein